MLSKHRHPPAHDSARQPSLTVPHLSRALSFAASGRAVSWFNVSFSGDFSPPSPPLFSLCRI